MRSIFYAVIAGLFCFFTSCQKEISFNLPDAVDSTGTLPPGSLNLVKTYTEAITQGSATQSTTFKLSYDANNRIISMISATNPGDKFVYQYNSNNTYNLTLYNSNVIEIKGTFFIKNDLLDSSMQYNNTQDTSSEKYLYDSNKKLVQLKEYEIAGGRSVLNSTMFLSYDSNGNVITETRGSERTVYTYTNLPNNLYMGDVFSNKNKNLVSTTTSNASGSNETYKHTYTFDSQNRLISEKITGSGDEVITKSYTY